MDPKDLYTSGLTNLLIAMTSLITAVGIVWVNVIVARAKIRVEAAAVAVSKKADEIGETTKTTLGHVNSAATEMRAVIDALRHENDQLRIYANDAKQIAAVLAATHAALAPPPRVPGRATDVPPGPIAAVVDPVAQTHLENIDANTAATAEAVQNLKTP